MWSIQQGLRRQRSIPGIATYPGSCDLDDCLRRCDVFKYLVVSRIGNKYVAGSVDGRACKACKRDTDIGDGSGVDSGGSSEAASEECDVAVGVCAGHKGRCAPQACGRRRKADRVLAVFAGGICTRADRSTYQGKIPGGTREAEGRRGCWLVAGGIVEGKCLCCWLCRRDAAKVGIGRDLAHQVVPGIGDQQVAKRIERHSLRRSEQGTRRRAAVSITVGRARAYRTTACRQANDAQVGRHPDHPCVACIRNKQVVIPIDVRCDRTAKLRLRRRAPRAHIGAAAGVRVHAAGYRRAKPRHCAALIQHPHTRVAGIRDEHVAVTVECHTGRVVQDDARCRATIAGQARSAGDASNRGDVAGLDADAGDHRGAGTGRVRDRANHLVAGIGDIQVARGIERRLSGGRKQGCRGRAAIAAKALRRASIRGDDVAAMIHQPDEAAACIADEQVTQRGDCELTRMRQHCLGCEALVAGRVDGGAACGLRTTRIGADGSGGIHTAHHGVLCVSDVRVPGIVDRHALRSPERSSYRLRSIPGVARGACAGQRVCSLRHGERLLPATRGSHGAEETEDGGSRKMQQCRQASRKQQRTPGMEK